MSQQQSMNPTYRAPLEQQRIDRMALPLPTPVSIQTCQISQHRSLKPTTPAADSMAYLNKAVPAGQQADQTGNGVIK
jgi:hypothetical protein